ncbi:PREDICTED: uncharacterized protein LOC107352956 [Acropora digitifera]|uniref:uncharacterized protein LOC107352956 n=1 Tax=Acropora digitifera TaxID=70779 RepID=UPI00077A6CF5|nr:PREDICTED: uncharacterized protein LOC107352956 [Acropora digitifera]
MEETLDYSCKNNRKSNSGRRVGTVTIKESRPILTHRISTNDAHLLYQNDSVKFTVFLNHDALSGDNAWNVLLVWILPYYAVFKSHEPETNITSPHPGEYHIGVEREASFCIQWWMKCISAAAKQVTLSHLALCPSTAFVGLVWLLVYQELRQARRRQ